ncbi:hypothetical protein BDK51DRAFT_50522 [Blyttiomyces helicus]|uniref:Uncharacterized protein n=1 Tax=Blyttiomyces helicus TaxID=388810 RepID=A0A4P9WDT8_9FUNG|nr:hypothetical protein BDK51DRAFT_50522 [Blyttiomyces helicus]|eukprot:RKO89843.1 hypothetical protein BDK51DRAFT_50522 [Blyttiomyces helicus]
MPRPALLSLVPGVLLLAIATAQSIPPRFSGVLAAGPNGLVMFGGGVAPDGSTGIFLFHPGPGATVGGTGDEGRGGRGEGEKFWENCNCKLCLVSNKWDPSRPVPFPTNGLHLLLAAQSHNRLDVFTALPHDLALPTGPKFSLASFVPAMAPPISAVFAGIDMKKRVNSSREEGNAGPQGQVRN